MQSISQDSQRVSLLFHYGVIDATAVIAWADATIVELNAPPDALLQLSTTAPDRTEDIQSLLDQLSSGAEFWPALKSSIPEFRNYLASHPDRAEGIANHLFLTVCGFDSREVPDDLRFIYRFDDDFTLARDGRYGNIESVSRDFIRELERF